MRRTAFKVAYIGSNFSGFQRQPDVRTVEGDIINTLMELEYIEDLKDARFRIAGRTANATIYTKFCKRYLNARTV